MSTTTIDYPTTDSLEAMGLRLYRQALIRIGVDAASATKAVGKGTPIQIRTRGIAEMVTGCFANERALEDAQMADTSVADNLQRLLGIYGVPVLNGAGASGNVTVSCSGSATYAANQELTSARNGKRYRVVTTTIASDGDPVGVVGIDVGTATNLSPGDELAWTSPPSGSAPTCKVSITGLIGGAEPDNDARKRKRLLKRLQAPIGKANWAALRQAAEDASASVSDAFVYPAVHGPCTQHVAIVIEGTKENGWKRAAPDALVALVREAVLAAAIDPVDTFVSTVAESTTNLSIKISIPDAGGDNLGWVDATPWPAPHSTNTNVHITTLVSGTRIICDAHTVPAVGSHFAVWAGATRSFVRAKVVAASGSAGAVTVDTDIALGAAATGDFLSPAAASLDAYADFVLAQVATVGPGERTAITAYERSRRRPLIGEGIEGGVAPKMITAMAGTFAEVSNAYLHAVGATVDPTKPVLVAPVPALDAQPFLTTVGQIGFYQ